MRLKRPLVLATLAAAAAFAACTLNPQPLPPSDDNRNATGGVDGSVADGGALEQPTVPAQDAGTEANDGEGGADADAGASDAGDASADAG